MRGLSRATLISLLSLSSHALAPQTRTSDPKSFSLSDFWERRTSGFGSALVPDSQFWQQQQASLAATIPWPVEWQGFAPVADATAATFASESSSEEDSDDSMMDVFALAVAASLVFESSGPGALALAAASLVCQHPIVDFLDNPVAGAVCAAEAAFYLTCMAYARHVTDTSAAQAHPYDPSLRREHWRRILSESPLPSAELVEGWFYRTGSKNDHPLDHNAAAILVEHMAQRITSALSFSSSSSRLSSSSLAGVKYEDLSVGDVRHWIARSSFSASSFDSLSPGDRSDAEAMAQEFEDKAVATGSKPLRTDTARTAGLETLCAYVDETRWRHRPLLYYGLTHWFAGLVWTPRVMAIEHGFQRRTFRDESIDGTGELHYWYRPGETSAVGTAAEKEGEKQDALVFIHGIGIGPAPYMDFVSQAAREGQPVVVLELPFASQRLSFDTTAASGTAQENGGLGLLPKVRGLPVPPRRFASLIDGALEELGIARAVVVGHSLGSAYAHYLSKHDDRRQEQQEQQQQQGRRERQQQQERRVAGLVLVDPIACCLYHPRVTSEFVYPPVRTPFQAADDYYVKKELFSAALVSRHLPWHEANVWLQDRSPAVPTLVALSDDDAVVPSEAVADVFGTSQARRRHGARVLRMPNMGHGQWLADNGDDDGGQRQHHRHRQQQQQQQQRPGQLPRLAREVQALSREAAAIGKARRAVAGNKQS